MLHIYILYTKIVFNPEAKSTTPTLCNLTYCGKHLPYGQTEERTHKKATDKHPAVRSVPSHLISQRISHPRHNNNPTVLVYIVFTESRRNSSSVAKVAIPPVFQSDPSFCLASLYERSGTLTFCPFSLVPTYRNSSIDNYNLILKSISRAIPTA